MALKETWIDRTYDDYIVPKTINELASAIIELEKSGASVIPTISVLEKTLRDHGMFINAEMPVYLGELRELVNDAPKDADGNIIESASKVSVNNLESLFPKDIGGNPVNLNTLLAFNKMGMPVSLKDILLYDLIGNPVDLKDIWLYDNIGRPIDLKSIMPVDKNGHPIALGTILPFNVLGEYEKVASQRNLEALEESVDNLEANTLKGSVSGAIVSMKDVSPIEHEMGVKARGKNKFYLNETKTRTAGGLSFNLTQGHSSFIVNGTSTTSSSAKLTEIPLKAGTYSIAIYGANVMGTDMDRIYLQYTDTSGKNVYVNNIVNDKPKTFTLPYDITARVDFVFAANSTYENKTICIQIEEGTNETAYAPYVADISAVRVKRCGKNLLNASEPNGETSGSTTTVVGNTVNLVKGAKGNAPSIIWDLGNYKPFVGKTLTLSFKFDGLGGSADNNSILVSIANGNARVSNKVSSFINQTIRNTLVGSVVSLSATVPEQEEYQTLAVRIYMSQGKTEGDYLSVSNVQLELDNQTEFESYKEPIEYTPNTDGVVKGITSLHPNTTLYTDTDGVIIDCSYNRDINIAFKNLEDKITALSAAMI